MPVFVLVFIAIPLLEIFLFIEVGGLIGAWSTILVVILTAMSGIWLLKRQGLQTLRNAQARVERDQVPAYELMEALLLLVAGLLLITPGFATDSVGFALLISKVRYWVIVQFGRILYSRFQVYSQRPKSGRGRVTIDVDAD